MTFLLAKIIVSTDLCNKKQTGAANILVFS
jgi:hypothetical protein